jgi:hypothetical protein
MLFLLPGQPVDRNRSFHRTSGHLLSDPAEAVTAVDAVEHSHWIPYFPKGPGEVETRTAQPFRTPGKQVHITLPPPISTLPRNRKPCHCTSTADSSKSNQFFVLPSGTKRETRYRMPKTKIVHRRHRLLNGVRLGSRSSFVSVGSSGATWNGPGAAFGGQDQTHRKHQRGSAVRCSNGRLLMVKSMFSNRNVYASFS